MNDTAGASRCGGRLRWAALPPALAMIALLVAACGGTHPAGSQGPGPGRVQQMDVFARCMRGHGEPNFYFANPNSVSSTTQVLSIMGFIIPGMNPPSPQFATAMKACKHLLPGGPPPSITQRQKEQLLKFAGLHADARLPELPGPQVPPRRRRLADAADRHRHELAAVPGRDKDVQRGVVAMSRWSIRRAAALAFLAGTAVLVAACGGGSHLAGAGASSPPELAQALDSFAHCMHRHGLPGLYVTRAPASPDPGATLLIFHGFAIQGVGLSSPQFQSAQQACQHLLPQGTPPTAAELHQQFISALKSARCMRAHGYPTWPDPKQINGRVGIGFASGIDTSSPQFQRAAKACGQPVPPGG